MSTAAILEAVEQAKRREDVVPAYRNALGESPRATDWLMVNDAIIERWSLFALQYIKERAWRQ